MWRLGWRAAGRGSTVCPGLWWSKPDVFMSSREASVSGGKGVGEQ